MNVEIKEIGKEDGYYDSNVTYVSLEQSFAEAALRLQLASGVNVNERILIVPDTHASDTVTRLSKLLEAFQKQTEVVAIEEPESVDYWYESGKKVAQWKREKQFTRQNTR
jgi:hypothetical protein